MAPDGQGGVIVAWEDARSLPARIYAQHITASGMVDPSWPSDGLAVCEGVSATQMSPVIASDGSGGAVIAWLDGRPGCDRDGSCYWTVVAQHVLGSGQIDPSWPVDGVLTNLVGNGNPPLIVATDSGATLLLVAVNWQQMRLFRLGSAGTASPGWSAEGVPVSLHSPRPPGQWAQSLLSDGLGGAFVFWAEPDQGSQLNLFAQHISANGSRDPAWPENGWAVCMAPANQLNLVSVSDGNGGALVAWDDQRPTNDASQIYATHVTPTGVDPGWPVDGLRVWAASAFQQNVAIADDGSGGAIVAWNSGGDVYAQHILRSGVIDPQWPGALPVCTLPDGAGPPRIDADRAGGAIVVWTDLTCRPGASCDNSANIFAQHVLSAGGVDPAWPLDGLMVAGASGHQYQQSLVRDEGSGWIVGWMDERALGGATGTDIYAQRIARSGVLGDDPVSVGSGPPTGLALRSLAPNPVHGFCNIVFDLPVSAFVQLAVLDISGRIASTVLERTFAAGRHIVRWEEDALPSGLYFIRMRTGAFSQARRVVLVRP